MYRIIAGGACYSPDRSKDVSHDNLHSQFLGVSGSRQGGYYYSPASDLVSSRSNSTGWYDGAGRFHRG